MNSEEEKEYSDIISSLNSSEVGIGISIIGENVENLINFINVNSKGGYSINNEKLEISAVESSKNLMLDDDIDNMIKDNKKIILGIYDLEISEGENPVRYFLKDDLKIILIDSNYFNNNVIEIIENSQKIKENAGIVDAISKALYEENGVSVTSFVIGDNDITGISTAFQNVYAGPSDSIYASIGSINLLEEVVVLGVSFGWYHIRYSVSSGSQEKFGYVPQSGLSVSSSASLGEEDFYGGFCYAKNSINIRSTQNFDDSVSGFGSVSQYEGMTLLYAYTSDSGAIAFVEYSTSNGTKRGYVYQSEITRPLSGKTAVASADENLTVYSGTASSGYTSLGSIYSTELVSILAKNDDWIYVEYNTTGGRKRGYISYSSTTPYNRPSSFPDLYTYNNEGTGKYINGSEIVYGGPNTTYANIGSVAYETIVSFDTEGAANETLTYIEYWITGSSNKKSGYIATTNIQSKDGSMENNTLTTLADSYNYFGEKHIYGQTQLGKDMSYYKAGNGANHMFLIFAHHGWEDGPSTTSSDGYYHGDGNILVRLAKNFIERFESTDDSTIDPILKEWTIYVFPGINLDGIVQGYTNNGFGRCLYNDLDPNRNWGGSFVANDTNPRFKTASEYFGAQELIKLRDELIDNIGSGKNVLLDIHGWYNQTVGNWELGEYFRNHMGISESKSNSRYGPGYLITWAKNSPDLPATSTDYPGLGADACLIELIETTDYSSQKIEDEYGSGLYESLIDILQNY